MIECCETKAELVGIFDTGSSFEEDYAYNLYICNKCGSIIKENVWSNPGCLKIKLDNTVMFEKFRTIE